MRVTLTIIAILLATGGSAKDNANQVLVNTLTTIGNIYSTTGVQSENKTVELLKDITYAADNNHLKDNNGNYLDFDEILEEDIQSVQMQISSDVTTTIEDMTKDIMSTQSVLSNTVEQGNKSSWSEQNLIKLNVEIQELTSEINNYNNLSNEIESVTSMQPKNWDDWRVRDNNNGTYISDTESFQLNGTRYDNYSDYVNSYFK